MLKIVHINTNDVAGGAARAAHRLHEGLLEMNLDSSMYVSRKTSIDNTVKQFAMPKGAGSRLYRLVRGLLLEAEYSKYMSARPDGYELFSSDLNRYGSQSVSQLPEADVFNLHWIDGFIEYRRFFNSGAPHKKVVWTLHDISPFTGGCHYDMGCERYLDSCGACPQLGSGKSNDLSRKIWKRKHRLFSSLDPSRIRFVALNKWMEAEAKRSPLIENYSVSVIPNSVDVSVYKPRDRRVVREFLGVNQDARIILFVSESIVNRRKGFSKLDQALQAMGDMPNTILLSVGNNHPVVHSALQHIHLGHINNDRWLSQIYSAADVFVIPSLQDNLPNTVLESLACGTPVVGFNVGGIPDMVRPGVTGLLAEPGRIDELQRNVRYLLENHELRASISGNCREVAKNEYSIKKQASSYNAIYEELLRLP